MWTLKVCYLRKVNFNSNLGFWSPCPVLCHAASRVTSRVLPSRIWARVLYPIYVGGWQLRALGLWRCCCSFPGRAVPSACSAVCVTFSPRDSWGVACLPRAWQHRGQQVKNAGGARFAQRFSCSPHSKRTRVARPFTPQAVGPSQSMSASDSPFENRNWWYSAPGKRVRTHQMLWGEGRVPIDGLPPFPSGGSPRCAGSVIQKRQ